MPPPIICICIMPAAAAPPIIGFIIGFIIIGFIASGFIIIGFIIIEFIIIMRAISVSMPPPPLPLPLLLLSPTSPFVLLSFDEPLAIPAAGGSSRLLAFCCSRSRSSSLTLFSKSCKAAVARSSSGGYGLLCGRL